MIAANGVTARYLASKGAPSLRRVLRTPEKWSRIIELAKQLREPLPRGLPFGAQCLPRQASSGRSDALCGFVSVRHQAAGEG